MPMEKTFNAAEAEARISALWLREKAFAAGANAKPGHPAFSVMIPPPNVTGSLHMGHAFNNTLQDILTRWHRMMGDDTLWQPGTDHAGIATQMVTERDMAKNGEPTRRDMGRDAFLSRVWQQKQSSRGTIIGQLQRLGASCDWDREAFTMSGAPNAPDGEQGNFHDAVIKVFVEMYNKGLIYRGKRLVNWDPHFETAISDLEVENIEVAGHMWHFKYRLAGGETYEYVEKDENGAVTLRETRDYISIATTRPETMLGDGAVAVHPSDERYAPIVGKMVHLPLCDRLIPIITDEYPDPTFGSGAVKITGAHDFNDYSVAKRANLPCYRLMDTRGAMRADGAPYAEAVLRAREIAAGSATTEAEVDGLNLVPEKYRGLDRFDARKAVIADINAIGLSVTTLVKEVDPETGSEHLTREPVVEAKKIMQPFGDRSKVVIEPMLTDQWFVDTAKIVEPALEAVRSGATKIIPESGEKTYYHWLENIEPWCISRQLWWGHQIPVWYGPEIEHGAITAGKYRHFCAPSEQEAIAAAALHYGDMAVVLDASSTMARDQIEDAEQLSIDAFFAAFTRRDASGKFQVRLRRDPDVLDTWFSSGLWPIGTLGWPEQTPELAKYFPTSTLITGQDIIFFWVARMMMMQLAVVDQVPFKTVYLHGLVRDAKGKKMSKSLGNVIDPLEIIDEYGADALRFANAAMASLGGVLKLDTQRIAGYRNFGTKLWNACRFAEMNGVWENHATQSAPPQASATVNKWIIGETAKAAAEVSEALENYRFDQAADTLYKFVWGKVCDWYVEFAKPLFHGEQADETRATMAWVLDQSMILLHPMMPFITEELWSTTGTRAKLLVHTDWPTLPASLIDAPSMTEMTWVTTLIDDIRSARAQVHVPVGLKLDLVATAMTDTAQTAWGNNETLIQRLARINNLSHAETAPKGAITVAAEGATFAIPLDGVIDIAEEKSRLQKSLDKLAKEIGGLKGRLNNPAFIASAPEDVVAEARGNLEAREDEAAKLQAAMARLAEIG
ncbi:MAG: valine--tRNA ligase [Pseudotabrizicola sp.]|uniref:valine--tRNA ligase n=1 Tax=Pseudotabrizicola sp. TaxID=2939647 RepID=UPI002730ED0B|nr:valine--tRNA ligase [Pseudotabrizicola sp.]MDP2080865.1 valine--tRNA ligase [Pseudotabrizicola sp.]MDZ7572733.1 valine--tRNA ligase [Pseudotabrizicola sp.]